MPSKQLQVWPLGQLPQGEVVQVVGNPPEPPRPPVGKLPPVGMPPLEPTPHWQFAMSQVWPEAQTPLQLVGQTQVLFAPQVAGGPQGGLQVAVTQAPFWQT